MHVFTFQLTIQQLGDREYSGFERQPVAAQ